jgi:hypothetical protein
MHTIPFKRDYFFEFNDLNEHLFTYHYRTKGLTNVFILRSGEVLKIEKGSYIYLSCSNICEILNTDIPNQKIKDLYWFIIQNDMYIQALNNDTQISYQKLR